MVASASCRNFTVRATAIHHVYHLCARGLMPEPLAKVTKPHQSSVPLALCSQPMTSLVHLVTYLPRSQSSHQPALQR